jgi:excinuclease UvrABC nuclease subunit
MTRNYLTKAINQTDSAAEQIKSGAVKVFSDLVNQRKEMSDFLKGKSGIYCFLNKTNGNYYIGSSVNLRRRIMYEYFANKNSGSSMIIVKAIKKYGLANFELFILEFCDKNEIISREDYFIQLYKPQYNILKKAGSLLGYKHNQESLNKMSESQRGVKHYFYGKTHTEETLFKMIKANKNSKAIEVLDLVTQISTVEPSIKEAARKFGLNATTIQKRVKNNDQTPIKNRFIITFK